MISINEFSSRELQKMDIHELRVLARQVGVSSPTSKKKADLIDCIVAIIVGKAVPEFKNINRGRPAKQTVSTYIVADISNYKPIFAINEFEDDFMVASPSGDYALNKRNAVVNGVVTKLDDGMYLKKFKFADTLDDAVLSQEIQNLYNLKENDVVTYAKTNASVDIHTINGKPASAEGKIKVAEKDIVLGKRNIVFVSSLTDKRNLVLSLQNYGRLIYLPGNSVPVITSPTTITIPLSSFTDDEIINNFCSSCDVAQFYKKSGGNVIFVSDNFLSVISAVKQFEYEKSVQLEQELFSKIQSLINQGITFIGIVPDTLKNVFSGLSTTFDNIC